jgi:hypothetical protein
MTRFKLTRTLSAVAVVASLATAWVAGGAPLWGGF